MIVLKLAPKEGFLNVQRCLGGVRYTDIAPLGLGKNKSNTQILFLDLADKWGLFSHYLSFAFVCA